MLSGPSGVGKSTVVSRLREMDVPLWTSVSVTTRPPRPGEQEGREYYFVDEREFDRLIAAGELLEWAPYVNLRHGTPRAPVERKLAAGVPVLLEIDLAGARQIRASVPDARMVFLAPPSWDELVRRLTGRGTEPPDVIERRLEAARTEMAAEKEFDVTLVNTSVQEVCDELVTLIVRLPRIPMEGRRWQGLPPPKASRIRPSTSCSRWWTASTAWSSWRPSGPGR